MKRKFKIGTAAASAVLVLVALTGCSGGASGDTTTAAAGVNLTEAKKVVAEAEAPVTEFSFPTEHVPIAKNKSVVAIPCSYAAEGCKRGADAVAAAVKLLGWKYTMIDPAGDPEKMRQAIRTAIQLKADAIFLGATPPVAVADDVKAARAAGIKVLNMYEPAPAGFADADSIQDHVQAGEWNAAYLAVAMNGKANVISVNDPEFESVKEWHQGFVDGLQKYCPTCKIVKDFNFEIANVQSQVPDEVQAALQANPTANSMWTAYDPVSLAAAPVVQASQQADGFKIVSHNGDPAALKAIKSGNSPLAATVGYSVEWQSWAAVDQALRLFAGTLTPKEALVNVPNKLLTKDNITSVPWNGDMDFESVYKKLWGLD